MIIPVTLNQLQRKFGGTIIGQGECSFVDVKTDSRAVLPGDAFVALKGTQFDAHDFVEKAIADGAQIVVVSARWASINSDSLRSINAWVVDNTEQALGQIAALVRNDFKGPLVAITGSCGKTTVKEMLAAIAAWAYGAEHVLATKGNLNNHFGVPLTLFNLTKKHQFAVIEMGASGPDEISYLVHLARPTVAIVNNVMAAHVEGFGSVDGVAIAKSAIYDGLAQAGTAIVNLDEEYASQFLSQNSMRRCLTFSLDNSSADIFADDVVYHSLSSQFQLNYCSERIAVNLQVSGRHNVMNALAAAACAVSAGIELESIAKGLNAFSAVKGRMNIMQPTSHVTVIDDTYNANPGSVRAAIDTLLQFSGQRWLVLGDMGELGADAIKLHAEVGSYAKAAGLDELVSVGPLSKYAAASFGSDKSFEQQAEAVTYLQNILKAEKGVINILIKGSRSAHMELIVQAITAQERAG